MYHLFAGNDFYAAGGIFDYRGVFSTPEAALAVVQENFDTWYWAHLVILVDGSLKLTHMYIPPGPYSDERVARWSSPWDDPHQMKLEREDWREITVPRGVSPDEP